MMNTERQQLLAEARDALLTLLPGVWAIYAYGSFARGDERADSDVDLAVLPPPGETIGDLLDLIGMMSMRVGRDVDVVDLRHAGDMLIAEILREGLPLFISLPDKVLEWEAAAMSRQARHREDIRGILDDFRKTGVGYDA